MDQVVPKIVKPGEGFATESPSEKGHVKLFAKETGGGFFFTELIIQPGFGPPYHLHTREDELFYVVEGEIEFIIDGARHLCPAGTTIFGPRGVPHKFRGAGTSPAKCVVLVTGSNFEEFYAKMGELMTSGESDPEALNNLAVEHGLQFLPEPEG